LPILQVDVAFTLIPLLFIILLLAALISSSIKIVKEYERAVIFRMGRLIGAKGPGLVLRVPIIDKINIVDLRLLTLDVPKQRIVTRDNVSVDVDAVVYFRVADPILATVKVQNFVTASSLLAQTSLRDIIGQVELDELLSKREELGKRIQAVLDEATDPWGVKVSAVAIKDVTIPESMQRAIAKQAEAERERRARIIVADGELEAAKKMSEAARFYAQDPMALRLRELQTWVEVARERNLIVVTEGGASALGSILGIMRRGQREETRREE